MITEFHRSTGDSNIVSSEHSIGNPQPRGGIPRLRPESIALLSYGFRPFFLGAALWACIAMVLWIGLLSDFWTFATGYGVIAWHAHEFLFGYVGAVMTEIRFDCDPELDWSLSTARQTTPRFVRVVARWTRCDAGD